MSQVPKSKGFELTFEDELQRGAENNFLREIHTHIAVNI